MLLHHSTLTHHIFSSAKTAIVHHRPSQTSEIVEIQNAKSLIKDAKTTEIEGIIGKIKLLSGDCFIVRYKSHHGLKRSTKQLKES
jgi:hypothetical protein